MKASDRPTLRDVPLPRRDDPIWILGSDVVRSAYEVIDAERRLRERDRVVLYG